MNKVIEGLKSRLLINKNSFYLINPDGEFEEHKCFFNPPATVSEINELEADIGYKLPLDYRNFLESCNGCRLFEHHLYGGENELYSITEIYKSLHFKDEEEEDHLLKIAYILQSYIYIDLKRVADGDDEYVYENICTAPLDYEGRNLHCNFDTWLYRFVSTNGTKYWEW
ncbi:SMI1/KNR4 family protein [Paenibacillus tarimensis]|uniref:SMI1/KNR4 family protein n=1 Tax=Paenibacillus tarimensis TaxID=416012 RepID=UPI001F3821D6|nr:SMI1/KNR4 family protein [Paenibacillus tarimensis]MCF2945439.1 SMI1/KNR4 family protein [Paenibacillus tarimensis]